MTPVVPLVVALVAVVLILLMFLFICSVLVPSNNKKNTGNQESVNEKVERDLRDAAQKALDAIGSKLSLTDKRSDGSKHVFNNGLLKIHRKVLEDLLKDVAPDCYHEQMENLEKELVIPLSPTHQKAISTMVTSFNLDEFYVDFNADLYGEYAKELRKALVDFLKADTSDNSDERNGILDEQMKVESITSPMVEYEVFVDPLARKRWLQENKKKKKGPEQKEKDPKKKEKDPEKKEKDPEIKYNEVRDALKDMFLNILQNFQNVSARIRDLRRGNRGNR